MRRLIRPRDLADNYVTRDAAIRLVEHLVASLRKQPDDAMVKAVGSAGRWAGCGFGYQVWREAWLADPPDWAKTRDRGRNRITGGMYRRSK